MASTGSITFNGAYIEYSLDCTDVSPTWTAFDCETVELDVSGGDRPTGEVKTFCGDTVINVGEQNPYEADVMLLYKDAVADAYQILLSHHLGADSQFGIRYSPAGNTTGNRRYSLCGCLLDVPLPSGSADDGTPVTVSLRMRAGSGDLTVDLVP